MGEWGKMIHVLSHTRLVGRTYVGSKAWISFLNPVSSTKLKGWQSSITILINASSTAFLFTAV